MNSESPWVDWAQRLQAIAQNGHAFSPNEYDRLRYDDVREIASEIMAHYTQLPPATFTDLWRGEKGYATPRIDVRGVVFKDNRILLVKERQDGLWTLPGGWADVGLSANEAVVKEVREESGYETRPARLLAVYDRNKHEHPPFIYHLYKIYIECELIGGAPSTSLETEGVDFFADEGLPELSLPRTLPRHIHRFFEMKQHPEWPPDLD